MQSKQLALITGALLLSGALSSPTLGQDADAMIASAMTAAPASVAHDATITDLSGNVLREGTNGWTCIPDDPDADGTNPWCFDAAWGNLRGALGGGTDPTYTEVGVAYMLAGDAPVSNTDPAATEATADNQWLEPIGAHLMLLVPGENAFAGYSSDPHNGGPWIMWPDTPYEHLMIPIDTME